MSFSFVKQVGSAGLCLCNSRLELYASANSFRTELYCQAVDSLDERLIGCCNTVDKENARLVRPSVRVPYLVLCDIHHQRLQRHNCCPGCGNFCTQVCCYSLVYKKKRKKAKHLNKAVLSKISFEIV